jgi:hypothetical protein
MNLGRKTFGNFIAKPHGYKAGKLQTDGVITIFIDAGCHF